MLVNGGQYAGTVHEDENYDRSIFGTTTTTMKNNVEDETEYNFNTWFNLNTDYRLDSINTLFANYTLTRYQGKPFIINTNEIAEDDVFLGTLNSEQHGIETSYFQSLAGGYARELDTNRSEFRWTAQYTNLNSDNESSIRQISNFGFPVENEFVNKSFNQINVYSTQADITKNFSEKISLSSGIKFSSISNLSGIDPRFKNNGVWFTDSSSFNTYDYQENIGAAYSEIKETLRKLTYQAGLRFETTQTNGSSYQAGSDFVNRKYNNHFPTVQLNYEITPDLILGGNYSYRIQRPTFHDMDPFIIFIDSLSSMRGNPNLLPTYTHSSELNLVYMEYASLSLSYQKSINPLFLTVERNPVDRSFSAITKNIESSEAYTLAAVIPLENDWWTTFNVIGYLFNDFRYKDGIDIVACKKPTLHISIYHEFRIPKLFNLELNYEYTDPGTQGFFVAKPMHFFMAGISRKFFNDQLNVNFSAFDPLAIYIERAEANLQDLYVAYDSWNDSKRYMLTLRWNFGKLKDASMKGSDIGGDEKDRIKNKRGLWQHFQNCRKLRETFVAKTISKSYFWVH